MYIALYELLPQGFIKERTLSNSPLDVSCEQSLLYYTPSFSSLVWSTSMIITEYHTHP
jgi:hypothetical protein